VQAGGDGGLNMAPELRAELRTPDHGVAAE